MAIKWNLPGPDEPGYMRRRRALIGLLEAPPTAASVDALVEHLVEYIAVPEDRQEAFEAALDLPSLEINTAIATLLGYSVPPPLSGASATGSGTARNPRKKS